MAVESSDRRRSSVPRGFVGSAMLDRFTHSHEPMVEAWAKGHGESLLQIATSLQLLLGTERLRAPRAALVALIIESGRSPFEFQKLSQASVDGRLRELALHLERSFARRLSTTDAERAAEEAALAELERKASEAALGAALRRRSVAERRVSLAGATSVLQHRRSKDPELARRGSASGTEIAAAAVVAAAERAEAEAEVAAAAACGEGPPAPARLPPNVGALLAEVRRVWLPTTLVDMLHARAADLQLTGASRLHAAGLSTLLLLAHAARDGALELLRDLPDPSASWPPAAASIGRLASVLSTALRRATGQALRAALELSVTLLALDVQQPAARASENAAAVEPLALRAQLRAAHGLEGRLRTMADTHHPHTSFPPPFVHGAARLLALLGLRVRSAHAASSRFAHASVPGSEDGARAAVAKDWIVHASTDEHARMVRAANVVSRRWRAYAEVGLVGDRSRRRLRALHEAAALHIQATERARAHRLAYGRQRRCATTIGASVRAMLDRELVRAAAAQALATQAEQETLDVHPASAQRAECARRSGATTASSARSSVVRGWARAPHANSAPLSRASLGAQNELSAQGATRSSRMSPVAGSPGAHRRSLSVRRTTAFATGGASDNGGGSTSSPFGRLARRGVGPGGAGPGGSGATSPLPASHALLLATADEPDASADAAHAPLPFLPLFGSPASRGAGAAVRGPLSASPNASLFLVALDAQRARRMLGWLARRSAAMRLQAVARGRGARRRARQLRAEVAHAEVAAAARARATREMHAVSTLNKHARAHIARLRAKQTEAVARACTMAARARTHRVFIARLRALAPPNCPREPGALPRPLSEWASADAERARWAVSEAGAGADGARAQAEQLATPHAPPPAAAAGAAHVELQRARASAVAPAAAEARASAARPSSAQPRRALTIIPRAEDARTFFRTYAATRRAHEAIMPDLVESDVRRIVVWAEPWRGKLQIPHAQMATELTDALRQIDATALQVAAGVVAEEAAAARAAAPASADGDGQRSPRSRALARLAHQMRRNAQQRDDAIAEGVGRAPKSLLRALASAQLHGLAMLHAAPRAPRLPRTVEPPPFSAAVFPAPRLPKMAALVPRPTSAPLERSVLRPQMQPQAPGARTARLGVPARPGEQHALPASSAASPPPRASAPAATAQPHERERAGD